MIWTFNLQLFNQKIRWRSRTIKLETSYPKRLSKILSPRPKKTAGSDVRINLLQTLIKEYTTYVKENYSEHLKLQKAEEPQN